MGFRVSCLSIRWIKANLRMMKGREREKQLSMHESQVKICVPNIPADVAADKYIYLVLM